MDRSIHDLLVEHQRGALSLEAVCARVRELSDADTAQLGRWVVEVRAAIQAGRISDAAGQSVLDLLTAANGATQRADEATQVKPKDATLLRRDATEPYHGEPAADDLTARIAPPAVATAARTLRASAGTLIRPVAEASQVPHDHTEVIQARLVKSLDQAPSAHHGPLQPGASVKNRFVLEQMIGKGGMGLVFAALDRRKQEAHDPNPRVAFKVLNADFQRHPQSLMALQREARKAQTLAHPNVVTVFDFDRDGDAVYMTMELLQGRSLESYVREGRGKGIDPKIALPIIRGIAEGLAYAHRKGIVHSDLKPGNIFILEDGTPKILDFGIARAVPNTSSNEAPDIFDAGVLGAYTEAYATDEMVGGVDPHPADDMYALGIIGYELITGFHPYQRRSAPQARDLGIKPPPMKGLKLREARALERCVSFDRRHRPQNAAEFLKAFRGVTALQQATLAAAVVLALATGYFSYESYRESGPAIPFSALPARAQQEFAHAMSEGDQEWSFYLREAIDEQLRSAVFWYAEAYEIHPRNRDATRALNKAADALLKQTGDNADERRQAAAWLQEMSDYYQRYEPVVDASR